MRATILKALLSLLAVSVLLLACGPKPAPGEKDRERGEQAVDQLPK